jgi:hypothetical protein
MAIAYFSSLKEVETLDLAFSRPQGGERVLRLLVDSGFTGHSSFVLPADAEELAQAMAPASESKGALRGIQRRIVVSCQMEALAFHVSAIAILADTSDLALPVGTQGLVGLRFLRHFRRWGAEQTEAGNWRFFLATDVS